MKWDAVSSDRPLRCVLYNEWPENNPACAAWLREMCEHFRCKTVKLSSSMNRVTDDDGTDIEDRYTVYEFVPRRGNPSSSMARDVVTRALVVNPDC